MADQKISELTAKAAGLAATDLIEISESDGVGGYVTKSVTGADITGGQFIAAYSNTIGTTITGTTNAISDSVLIPAGTFRSDCQIDLTWFVQRLAGTGTAVQGLVYINSSNTLTGATLVATGGNMSLTGVTNTRCTRNINVRNNLGTLYLVTSQTMTDYSAVSNTENLAFDNSTDIYVLFVMNNVAGATLQSRNVGYRIIGYNL